MDSPSETGAIRSRKPQDPDGQRYVQLPEQTVLRLEQLRQQTGKHSIAEVVAEATELYACLRASGDLPFEQLLPRAKLMKKLRIRDLAGLVRYAIRIGVILP